MDFRVNGSEIIRNVDLIIFDKDGVLVDLNHYWCEMLRIRSRIIGEYFFSKNLDKDKLVQELSIVIGLDRNDLSRLDPMGPIGSKSRAYVVNLANSHLNENGFDATVEMVESLFKEADEWSITDMDSIIKAPVGIRSFIKTAHEKGLKMAIATSDITERAKISMRTLGIEECFNCVVGSDSVTQSKPSPESIEKILDQLGTHSARAIMIGDHWVDMEMSRVASLPYRFAIGTGLTLSEEAKRTATHVITDINCLEFI